MKLFPTKRFFAIGIFLAVGCFLGFFYPLLFTLCKGLVFIYFICVLVDWVMLYGVKGRVQASRKLPERFSNGDANEVAIEIANKYPFLLKVHLIDEIPVQFQIRDFGFHFDLPPSGMKPITYSLVPKARGVYLFDRIVVLASTRIDFFQRKFSLGDPQQVKVYPSFLNLGRYELQAISQSLKLSGQKRMRRVGQSTEFDHIKEYVLGDDPRHINWNASARRGDIMLNHYTDEKSQAVYAMIDKGRAMKMPFEGMTLLDYSINAALVLSNIAIKKGDRAGLITFQDTPETYVPAQKRNLQISYLLESLYSQTTSFKESDFPSLYPFVAHKVKQRSLLLLFTNFESTYSLERQLPYLKLINRHHLLLVVFFKNTQLEDIQQKKSEHTLDIYYKSIAHQIADEKANIHSILQQHGILSLYTRPQHLNADVINKYIEIKTRRMV